MYDSKFKVNAIYNQKSVIQSVTSSFIKGVSQKNIINIPTILSLIKSDNDLQQELLDSYRKAIPSNPYGYIPNHIQCIQSSLLEGFVFAYHNGGDDIALYTSNVEFFQEEGNSMMKLDENAIAKLNSIGLVSARKLEITYNSPTEFHLSFNKNGHKHSKPENLVVDDCVFIPMEVVLLYTNMIKVLLSEGKVLLVEENHKGVSIERVFTQNAAVLKRYSDNEVFSSGVSVRRYVQLGTHSLYAPVVGNTSNTYGLEPIDVLRLNKLSVIADDGELSPISLGNERYAIVSSIMRAASKVYTNENAHIFNDYIGSIEIAIGKRNFLKKMKHIVELEPVPDNAIISLETLHELLSSFSDEELAHTWSEIHSKDSVPQNENLLFPILAFTSSKWEEKEIPKTVREFNNLLTTGVFRVVISKNNEQSVSYITQNKEIASQIYSSEAMDLLNGLKTIQNLTHQQEESSNEVTGLGLFGFRIDSGSVGFYQNFQLEDVIEVVQVYDKDSEHLSNLSQNGYSVLQQVFLNN